MATEFNQDTHGNSDHVAGAGAFAPGGASDTAEADSRELLPGTPELVEEIKARLRAGDSFNNRSFSELVNGALGGSRMQGTFSAKYAYDVLEAALNRFILEQHARALMEMADPRLGLAHVLMPLVAQLPTQVDRTLDQQLLQQFSTPPTIGYVAARVLAPRKSDLVMEPSAGTGSLAIWPRAIGADVLTNEVSLRRLALLELLGFKPSSYDAEFLDDLYPPEVIPTAFLMNPPFSATGGRVERNSSLYGARHIETSLRRMAQGGRLVSIAGEGMKLDKPAFRLWWQRIASAYTVRAVVGVDGKFYSKFGTTFDDSLIVIDKTGPTPGATWEAQLGAIQWGDAATLEQLWEMLARVAADRPEIGEIRTKPPAPVVAVLPVEKEPAAEAEGLAATPTVASGAPSATQSAPAPHAQQTTPARDDEADALVMKQEGEEGDEQEEADIFIQYTPAMLTGGINHPALIVESRSMASVYPPPITYRPHFPRRVVKRGLLSALQLERVCYAGQAHEQRLPDGARGGFFVGDGTGVGKGRSQPLDAKVLTPSGWKLMRDIKAGDEVIAVDGKPTRVIGVYPQGVKDIYRITFSDGSQTECSEDHLWLTQTKRQRYYERHGLGVNYPRPKTLTTAEIARTIKLSHSIPLVRPVQFAAREVRVDPYLLGVLLADGHIRKGAVQFATADAGVLEQATAGVPDGLAVKKVSSRQYHYDISKPTRKWKGLPLHSNALVAALRDYGLAGVKAPDKFVPEDFKFNAPAIRLSVLQGLMDCDGYVNSRGTSMYYTVSARLADDLTFLVQSLGGVATRGLKRTTHLPCHVIYIKLPGGMNPFRLKRKAGRVKPDWVKYPPQRLVEKIELVGEKEAQCIAVAHPARLYVTDDFVVTHNTLAGIIVDNWFQGYDRAVWLSVNNDLMDSARRDLNDLGVRVPLHKINDFDVRKPITATCGVIFSSYSSLIASAKSGETRLAQLMEWLGPNGVIILDEAHKAKNALAGGRGEPTQTGQAVIDLQSAERNPDYRVVYSSATGATDVRHMSYMVRLGLWGEGTPFPGGFGEFMTEIDSGGVGAMEMVCRDLKALGKYASASISFGMDPESGLSVEYREVIHKLTPQQRAMYDAMSEAWLIILQNIDQALELTNGDNRARANAMQKFWGDHQRCCRSVISAFKVPSLIAEVERELGAGHACVISLIGTGESKTKEQISKQTASGGQIEDLDFSPREMICGMVDRGFPTTQYVEKTDPSTGQTIKVPLLDGEGKAVESKEALRMKQALLDKLSRLDLPEHPLDQLVNYFGPKHVAELTGRKRRLIRQPGGKLEYVKRNPEGVAMQNVNLYEMGLFQEGKKDIAIISDAASTGISLHADRRAGNQKRRVHLTLELNWSADKQLQTFGRTHRSNQVAPPIYVLLSTELGGEKRFSSTIAKRLASLGALTKGDRGAADGGDLTKYNFETDEGSAALNLLYSNILRGVHIDGLTSPRQTLRNMGLLVRRQDGGEEVKKENLHNIPRFLNRVLALPVDEQNAMFNYFVELFEQTIRFAKANGTFDEGVQDIKAKAIRLGATPRVVHQDELTGAKTTHYKLEVDQPTRPVSFKEARETPRGTFYRQKKSGHYVLAAESGNHTDPNTGATYRTFSLTKPEAARAYYVKESELVEKYQPVQPRDARMWWDFRYGQVPEVVTVEVHIIGGAILPLWQHLKTDEGAGLRVARVTTDEGQRIVGIQIPKAKLARVLRALGISRSFKEPAQIFSGVLEEGEEINLVGGLKLRKSIIHGEEAVEVICADPYRFDELRVFGLINESIAYKQRFFIPTDELKGLPVLTALLTRYPAISTEEEMKETTAADLDELLAQRVSDVDRADLVVNIEEHIIVPEGHDGDDEQSEVFSADPHAPGQPTLQLVAGELNFEGGTDEETEAGVEAKAAPAPVEEDDETNFDVIPTSPAAAPASPQPSLFEQAASAEVKPTKGKKNKKVDDGRQGLLWAA